jgi:nucleoid-associated protein YgaU
MSEQKIHTVQSGETLSSIAKHYYGDANEYIAIFEANKDKLSDPDKIQVGQELVIPMGGGAGGAVRSN